MKKVRRLANELERWAILFAVWAIIAVLAGSVGLIALNLSWHVAIPVALFLAGLGYLRHDLLLREISDDLDRVRTTQLLIISDGWLEDEEDADEGH